MEHRNSEGNERTTDRRLTVANEKLELKFRGHTRRGADRDAEEGEEKNKHREETHTSEKRVCQFSFHTGREEGRESNNEEGVCICVFPKYLSAKIEEMRMEHRNSEGNERTTDRRLTVANEKLELKFRGHTRRGADRDAEEGEEKNKHREETHTSEKRVCQFSFHTGREEGRESNNEEGVCICVFPKYLSAKIEEMRMEHRNSEGNERTTDRRLTVANEKLELKFRFTI
ncbi:hypothetical protein niasHT_022693 [Heterodera trifolii]|uniref:Uncharacterized protein n=1 Tax=Heterodera trifolii TaxID=157864 RepID=A0ABD2KNR3_9BILA